MKKIFQFVFMVLVALGCCLPGVNNVEAASIGIIPLVDNVGYEGAGQAYYNRINEALKKQDTYEMIESSELDTAIEKNSVKDSVPTKEGLMAIAEDGNVDLVVAVQLDRLEDERIMNRREETLLFNMRGLAVSYNRLTGEYIQHKIYANEEFFEDATVREDWKLSEFGRAVTKEINRIMKVKKINVDKPRITKLK